MFAIVSSLQKKSIFVKIDDFFYLLWLKLIYFQVKIFSLKNFFYSECKKLKRILLALEICFWKIKNV